MKSCLLIVCTAILCGTAVECVDSFSVYPYPLQNLSSYTSLDIAFGQSMNLTAVCYRLIPANSSFAVDSVATIMTNVSIEGEYQRVVVAGRIVVESEALLNVTQTEFRSFGNLGAVFEVRGKLWLEECAFNDFTRPIFDLFGEIQVRKSNISRSTEVGCIVNSEKGTLLLYQVTVKKQTGTFLSSLAKKIRFGQGNIQISECVFQNAILRNRESLFDIETKTRGGVFHVTDSLFSNNNSPLFYFDVIEFTVRFDSSEFLFNDRTVFTVYALDSTFEIENITARHNADILLDIYQFRGDFSILNSSISEQQRMGPIRLYNSLNAADCHFSMFNSRFFDIEVKSDRETPGALTLTSCIAFVSDVSIRNVTIAGMGVRDVYGLLYMERGQMTIENVYTEDSGSAGAFIFSLYGNLTIRNSFFNNPLSNERLFIIATFGYIIASNIKLLNGGIVGTNNLYLGAPTWWIFALESSVGKIENITIHHTTAYFQIDIVFAMSQSRLSVSNVYMENFEIGCILGFLSSSGSISNITINNCKIGSFGIKMINHSTMQIKNLFIDTVNSVLNPRGIFSLTSNSTLNAYNLYFANLNLSIVITAVSSSGYLENVTVIDSNIEYLVYYPLRSNIEVRNVNFSRSIGGIVYATESNVSFVGGTLDSIVSKRCLIGGVLANIRINGTKIYWVKSSWQIAKIEQSSYLEISDSHIEQVDSDSGEGIRILNSNLTITRSTMASFSVSLIQAYSASVTITDSVFRDGNSPMISMKSKLAFGGVLGCEDCVDLVISDTTFYNVTARGGGAISMRKHNYNGIANAIIRNSSFMLCKAYMGGAVLIQNVTFIIETSMFMINTAENTGGAIDISIPSSNSGLIENCTFVRNRAFEGGAVKWHNAEITFVRATFIENNAKYGSDIASYGISLALASAQLNEKTASGFPVSLAFELLDHYGHRVTTATNKNFRLVSTSIVSFRGNEVSMISEGVFNFSELTVYAPPYSSQLVSGMMVDTQGDFNLNLRGDATVALRECVMGEIKRSDRCEYCYSGNVSYSIHDGSCHFCSSHAFCPGGATLFVDPHYWRQSWNSTVILKCPLEDKCLGGPNSSCSDGFSGLLCNQCADDFYRFRTIECGSCGNRAALWIQMLAIFVVVGLFVFGIVKNAHGNSMKLFAIKTFVHHAQFLSAMSPLKMSFPEIVKNSLHGITYLSSLSVADLPLACLGYSAPEYARAIIGSLLLPTLILIYAIVCRLFTKSWKASIAILTTSSMLFTPLVAVSVLVPLLACQNVDSEELWLFLDMNQQCWNDSHLLMVYAVFIPSLILNVLLPIAVALYLGCKFPSIFDTYFPLWKSGYKWRCWDVLLLISKVICFVLLITSLSYDKLSQLTYGLIVMIVTCVLNVSLFEKVYLNDRLFWLSEVSLVIVTASMGLSGFYIYSQPGSSASDYFVSLLFVLINGGFLSVVSYLMRSSYLIQARASVNSQSSVSAENQLRIGVPNNSMIEFPLDASSTSQ